MISTIILAAGLSRRMGKPKLLLPCRGKSLVRTVAENVLACGQGEVIVVAGAYRREIAEQLSDLQLVTIYNPLFASGQGTSLAAGAKAVNPSCRGVMVLMGDQPLIIPSLISSLAEFFMNAGCLIMRPTYRGCPGHPVFFHPCLLPELVNLSGDYGARQVLESHRRDLLFHPVDDCAVCFDVDTPEDYRKWLKLLRSQNERTV